MAKKHQKYLKKAIWLFPLYLLLFNVFVIFIAWAGKITFGEDANAEYYTLLLPLENGNSFLLFLSRRNLLLKNSKADQEIGYR